MGVSALAAYKAKCDLSTRPPKMVSGAFARRAGTDRSRFPALALQSDDWAWARLTRARRLQGMGKCWKPAGIPIERQPIQRNFVVY
jgi:hypothetical protein